MPKPPGDRQSLDALALRLEHEPDVPDVIVEGDFDFDLFRFVKKRLGLRATSIRPVDWLHVPSELFPPAAEPGNRDRIVRAAEYVGESVGSAPHIWFVYDRDLDVLTGETLPVPNLIGTDGSCPEMYLWDEETVDRTLHLYSGVDIDAERALAEIRTPMEELFLIRLADRETGIHAGHIAPGRLVTLGTDGSLHFDRAEYITRLLNKGSAAGRRDEFEAKTEEFRGRLPSDSLPAGNGHDFVELLRLFVHASTGKSPQGLDRALLASVPLPHLLAQPMIRDLVEALAQFES